MIIMIYFYNKIKLLIKRYLYEKRVKKLIYNNLIDYGGLDYALNYSLIFAIFAQFFLAESPFDIDVLLIYLMSLILYYAKYEKTRGVLKRLNLQSFHINKLFNETKTPFNICVSKHILSDFRFRDFSNYRFYFNNRYIKYNKSLKQRILKLPRHYLPMYSFSGENIYFTTNEVLDRELPNKFTSQYYFEILGPIEINSPVQEPRKLIVPDYLSNIYLEEKNFQKTNQVLVAKICKTRKSEGENDDYEDKLVLISRLELGLFDVFKD